MLISHATWLYTYLYDPAVFPWALTTHKKHIKYMSKMTQIAD